MLALLLGLACAPAPDNGNVSRRGGARDVDEGADTATDTGADTGETGTDSGTGTDTRTDSGGDTGPALPVGTYEGPLYFLFEHPSWGGFPCDPGSELTLESDGSAFVATGRCSSTDLGVWRFALEGRIAEGALALDTLDVVAETWGTCAVHTTGAFTGTLSPEGGALSLTFTTDYTPCGQPYTWDGALSATLRAAR